MRRARGLYGSIGLGIGLTVVMAGCGARGPAFQPVSHVPENKALVYVYRPDSILGGAVSYTVHAGDEAIVHLVRGGYYPYFATPGETEFWAKTEAKTSVTQVIEPGKTYYLQGGIGIGVLVGRPTLTFVEEAEGQPEVAECKLLSAGEDE